MKRVALLIETSRSYGRDILHGVNRYAIEHGPWSLFVELRDLESKPPAWLAKWDGDGILTRSGNAAIATAVKRVGVPTVELRSQRRGTDFPFIGIDNQAVGIMVADHLLDRGFRHFGVYELDTESFFVERRDSFVNHLQQKNLSCSPFRQQGRTEKPSQWERQQDRLMQWISKLPKPVGIMACTDQLGCWLLDACRREGVNVPEQVAVVGVENDETLTAVSSPPLSSVRLAGQRIGYEAARILDRLMSGRRGPRKPTLIRPLGIETRQSSNVVAVSDPLLAQAIQFIGDKACHGIRVADILQAVPISRTALERGCRRAIGRSPNQEINHVRLNEAQQLLLQTDFNLHQIARRTGFATPQYFLQSFKKSQGITPGEFRQQSRLPSADRPFCRSSS